MNATVDETVASVSRLVQIQYLLFDFTSPAAAGAVAAELLRYLRSVTLDSDNIDEEVLRDIKRRIKAVVDRNTPGPQLLVLMASLAQPP